MLEVLPGNLIRGEIPRNPVQGTPERVIGAVRRTGHIQTTMHQGDPDLAPMLPAVTVRAGGRDLITTADGPRVVDETSMVAEIDAERLLRSLTMTPGPAPAALIGVSVGSGYRRQALAAAPELVGTLQGMHLMDLPSTSLVGVARLADRPDGTPPPPYGREASAPNAALRQLNVCTGWKDDGWAIAEVKSGRPASAYFYPKALSLATADAMAYHQLDQMLPLQMRRLRRIDLRRDAQALEIDAHHRDSCVRSDGYEVVIHEYTLRGRVHPETLVIEDLEAIARVLPFPDCSLATAEVTRMIGVRCSDAVSAIGERVPGVHGCTHLSDLLSNLAGIPRMATQLSP
jgi:hypothetical protein